MVDVTVEAKTGGRVCVDACDWTGCADAGCIEAGNSKTFSLNYEDEYLILTPDPYSGYDFDRWEYDGSTSTDRSLVVSYSDNVTSVKAYFKATTPPPSNLSVTISTSDKTASLTATWDDGIKPFYVRINWGDGDLDEDTTSANSYSIDHTYGDYGTYTVTVYVEDDAGRSVTRQERVDLPPPEPSVVLSVSPSEVYVGDTVTASVTAYGGSGPPYKATVDWGDGSVDTKTIYSEGGSATFTHSYDTPLTYTVEARVMDSYGTWSDTDRATVKVNPKPAKPPHEMKVTVTAGQGGEVDVTPCSSAGCGAPDEIKAGESMEYTLRYPDEYLTITANPYGGYVFDRWVVDGQEYTDESIVIQYSEDISSLSVTGYFKPEHPPNTTTACASIYRAYVDEEGHPTAPTEPGGGTITVTVPDGTRITSTGDVVCETVAQINEGEKIQVSVSPSEGSEVIEVWVIVDQWIAYRTDEPSFTWTSDVTLGPSARLEVRAFVTYPEVKGQPKRVTVMVGGGGSARVVRYSGGGKIDETTVNENESADFDINQGEYLVVTPIPKRGFRFTRFLLDGVEKMVSELVIDYQDPTVEVEFEPEECSNDVTIVSGEGGHVEYHVCSDSSCSGYTVVVPNQPVTVTISGDEYLDLVARPDSGYDFDHWEVDGAEYTDNPVSYQCNPDVNSVTITAYFRQAPAPPPPEGQPQPLQVYLFAPDSSYEGSTVGVRAVISGGVPPYTVVVDWGDGNSDSVTTEETVAEMSHVYETAGDYTITVRVEDSEGSEDTDSSTITIRQRPSSPSPVPPYTPPPVTRPTKPAKPSRPVKPVSKPVPVQYVAIAAAIAGIAVMALLTRRK